MSYQDRLTSPGPARDDPLLGDTTTPTPDYQDPYAEAGGSGEGSSAKDKAREAADTGRQQAQNVASTAKGEAQNVASTARDEAQNVASTAKDEARNVAQTAQGQARRLVGDARSELTTQADGQMSRLADGITQISQQLRSMGDNGDAGPVADLAGEAAWRTEQFADRLRSGGIEETLTQVRRFGRNRPGLFLLGAFGVGIVAGRVVRNLAQDPTEGSGGSSSQAYDSGYGSYGAGYADPATSVGAYDPYATPDVAPAVAPGGTYAERYEVPADATGVPVPPADPANAAYGAPANPDYTEGTAPVGEQRWGT